MKTINGLVALWKKEPIAVLYVVGLAIWTAYNGYTDELGWVELMQATFVALGAGVARMTVYSPATVEKQIGKSKSACVGE